MVGLGARCSSKVGNETRTGLESSSAQRVLRCGSVGGDVDELEVLIELQVVVRAVLALGVVELEDAGAFGLLFPFAALAAPRCSGCNCALRFLVR